MNRDFEDILRDSRPRQPDPGTYRHLNRAFLVGRMETRPKRTRRRALVLAAAVIAFVAVFGGRLTDLGSYDGAVDSETRADLLGGRETVHSQKFGTLEFEAPEDAGQAEIRQLHESIVAEDYEVVDIRCLTVGGRSNWTKTVLMNLDGRREKQSRWTDDFPAPVMTDQFAAFYKTHMAEVVARTRSFPPDETGTLAADGHVFAMEYWHFTFPGFGRVTYAKGTPRTRP